MWRTAEAGGAGAGGVLLDGVAVPVSGERAQPPHHELTYDDTDFGLRAGPPVEGV
ncbi:hypothetical protein [Streptomyces tubercidicus]|uniref:hypothetical protein n=1 Tax=Streptomyces tubercidicus TaxID=47759 RepID=UPI0036A4D548